MSTLDKAASIAENLAFGLRQTAQDESGVSIANVALHDLLQLLPELQESLRDMTRRRDAEYISQAAGNALSHTWVVTADFDLITCTACRCQPTGYLLVTGSVPVCDPTEACPHSISGVHSDEEPRDGGRCIFCKTVYPATADSRKGVSS